MLVYQIQQICLLHALYKSKLFVMLVYENNPDTQGKSDNWLFVTT